MRSLKNYQPEIVGVVVGIAVLNIWYLSAVAVENSIIPQSYDYLIKGFTVAIGAFIGAFSAFWLKKSEENNENTKKKKAALNSALFILVRQINAISCIKRDLDQYNSPLERALSLPAFKPPDYSDVRQDIDSLNFLIELSQAQMLMELTIEQERFEQAINSINIRNEFYVNEVQPALSYHSLNGHPLPITEFEEKLGDRLFQGSLNGAATMYNLVYSSHESLYETYESLRSLAKEIFPHEKFISWQPKNLS